MFEVNPDGARRDYDKESRNCFNSILDDARGSNEPQYGSEDLILDHKLTYDERQNCQISLDPPGSILWRDRIHHVWRLGPNSSRGERRSSQGPSNDSSSALNEPSEFSYQPIQVDSCEFRLLNLLPHHGNTSSPLIADLKTCPLYLHNCYIAVRNSRGNPALTGSIMVNSQRYIISKNLEVFLRHMRLCDLVRCLWIREICVNKDNEQENRVCFNFRFQKIVEDCSCGIVLLDRVMETLADHGLLQKQFQPRAKVWDSTSTPGPVPRHYPVHLGRMFLDEDPTFTYKYLPLDLMADEVRLLVIPPAADREAPLVADLAHEPMHGSVSYEALSYIWGDAQLTKPITISGQTMHITSNLDAALRDLRHPKYFCVLWVDAICIDQANQRERSRLIPRMQEIYDAAKLVFVWLGPKNAFTDTAFDFVRELYQPELTAFEQETPDARQVIKKTPRLAKAWAATYELMHSPFFRRRWIIQELASAGLVNVVTGKGKYIHWHAVEITAENLWWYWNEIYQLWKEYEAVPEGHRELEWLDREWFLHLGLFDVFVQLFRPRILSYVRNLRAAGQSTSFLLLAILSHGADCADPRDRIYALWNISNDCRQLSIEPDYSKSMEEVYIDFAKAYATYHRSLDIICATQSPSVGMTTPRLPGPVSNDLPAWCPDWRQDAHMNSFVRTPKLFYLEVRIAAIPLTDSSPYHADKISRDTWPDIDDYEQPLILLDQLLPFAFEDHYLIASGAIIDSVEHTSQYPIEWLTIYDGPPSEWSELLESHCHNPDGSRPPPLELQSHAASMFLGLPPGAVKATPKEDGSGDYHHKFLAEELKHGSCNWTSLRNYIIRGRRFIVTKKGYMGLAPWYVRPGFHLAILLGCSVPVVLEEVNPDEAGRNTEPGLYFRGDCFVQGWMEGEMMREFGETTEEAWENICLREKIRIM
ncbi:MAG: hypothetical protein Q9160_004029 [Pyrenula sp. 1 TL-2023]